MKLIHLLRNLVRAQILFLLTGGAWAELNGNKKYSYSLELVKDIWPGEDSSLLRGFVNFNGKVSSNVLDCEDRHLQ